MQGVAMIWGTETKHSELYLREGRLPTFCVPGGSPWDSLLNPHWKATHHSSPQQETVNAHSMPGTVVIQL